MKNIRLGDVLIEFGYITAEQLNAALAYQKEHRDLRVGQALQELGYVNERQVLEALAKRLQIRMIDIEHTNVDVTAVEKVPQELAQKYDMLPIAQSGHTLTIAANDPLNYYAIEDIRQLTAMEPEIVLAELEPLRRAVRYYYAEVSARKAARSANSSDMAAAQTEDLAIDMTAEGGDLDAPIIRLLNSLVQRAVTTTASDIHIEPFEGETKVRMRIDGVIIDYVTLQRRSSPASRSCPTLTLPSTASRRTGISAPGLRPAPMSMSVSRSCRPSLARRPCCVSCPATPTLKMPTTSA